MKKPILILLIIGLYLQMNCTYSQDSKNKTANVEFSFDMYKSLGVIFCTKLNQKVYNSAFNGNIPVYKTSDLKPEEKLNQEQIKRQMTRRIYGEQMFDTYDLDSDIIFDTILRLIPLKASELSYPGFIINWQLDTNGYSYSGNPYAFALRYQGSDIFWISIKDLKKIVAPCEYYQLQEAIFLNIYTLLFGRNDDNENDDYSASTNKWYFDIKLKSFSTDNLYINSRLNTGLDQLEWKGMNFQILNDVYKGKLDVYHDDSLAFGKKLIYAEILSWQIQPDSIKGYSVAELWKMDYDNNRITGEITGISLNSEIFLTTTDSGHFTFYSYAAPGNSKGSSDRIVEKKWSLKEPLFFVPYKYVETIIGKQELYRLSTILFNSLVKNYLEQL